MHSLSPIWWNSKYSIIHLSLIWGLRCPKGEARTSISKLPHHNQCGSLLGTFQRVCRSPIRGNEVTAEIQLTPEMSGTSVQIPWLPFQWELTRDSQLPQTQLTLRRLPSMTWEGLVQATEGPQESNLRFPGGKEFCLKTVTIEILLKFSACWPALQSSDLQPHNGIS